MVNQLKCSRLLCYVSWYTVFWRPPTYVRISYTKFLTVQGFEHWTLLSIAYPLYELQN
jgi:hypothetical protein